MNQTQEWQIKTLFHNNFSKLGITNLPNKFFYPQQTKLSAMARKCQTFREMTFAKRGNAKPKVLILQHDRKRWFQKGVKQSSHATFCLQRGTKNY